MQGGWGGGQRHDVRCAHDDGRRRFQKFNGRRLYAAPGSNVIVTQQEVAVDLQIDSRPTLWQHFAHFLRNHIGHDIQQVGGQVLIQKDMRVVGDLLGQCICQLRGQRVRQCRNHRLLYKASWFLWALVS